MKIIPTDLCSWYLLNMIPGETVGLYKFVRQTTQKGKPCFVFEHPTCGVLRLSKATIKGVVNLKCFLLEFEHQLFIQAPDFLNLKGGAVWQKCYNEAPKPFLADYPTFEKHVPYVPNS